jgi:hypothetical protein
MNQTTLGVYSTSKDVGASRPRWTPFARSLVVVLLLFCAGVVALSWRLLRGHSVTRVQVAALEAGDPNAQVREHAARGLPSRVSIPLRSAGYPALLASAESGDLIPQLAPIESARLNLEKEFKELEHSGLAHGAWTSRAAQLCDEWRSSPSIGGLAEVIGPHCFDRGCSIVLKARDAATASSASTELEKSDAFTWWKGGTFRTGPIPSSTGAFETFYILFRPLNNNSSNTKELP